MWGDSWTGGARPPWYKRPRPLAAVAFVVVILVLVGLSGRSHSVILSAPLVLGGANAVQFKSNRKKHRSRQQALVSTGAHGACTATQSPGDSRSRIQVGRQLAVISSIALVLGGCGTGVSVDIPLPSVQLPIPGKVAVAPPPNFSQEDARWAHHRLGVSSEPSHDLAWGGCYVTSVAMLFDAYLPNFTDPAGLNQSLIASNGFQDGGVLDWSAAASLAPLNMSFKFTPNKPFSWNEVDSELAAHRPVLVPVKGIRDHIVLIWAMKGSGSSASYSVVDPQKGGAYTWQRSASSHSGDNGRYEISGLTVFAPG